MYPRHLGRTDHDLFAVGQQPCPVQPTGVRSPQYPTRGLQRIDHPRSRRHPANARAGPARDIDDQLPPAPPGGLCAIAAADDDGSVGGCGGRAACRSAAGARTGSGGRPEVLYGQSQRQHEHQDQGGEHLRVGAAP
ncbi:hypothetical protein O1L68_28310 [Streptomyces lydicus]|nr:hypothetical protein [Streptomyces lydicus]